MRKQIDIEELAMKLHELFDCDIVEIYEHRCFSSTSALVFCYDADEQRTQSFILPIRVVASDAKYCKGHRIEYVFDFSKSDEKRMEINDENQRGSAD